MHLFAQQGDDDSIHHTALLDLLKRRVHDADVLKLVEQLLQAGVMEDGNILPTRAGTPHKTQIVNIHDGFQFLGYEFRGEWVRLVSLDAEY